MPPRSIYNLRKNPNLANQVPINKIVREDGQIKRKKHLYVCGFGGNGALGIPKFMRDTKNEDKTFTKVDKKLILRTFGRLTLFGSNETISDISCGHGFTVIAAKMDQSSHTAFGFGLNNYSQFGAHCQRPGFPLEYVATPQPIVLPTDSPIAAVSCGRAHTLLLNRAHQVFSLGLNSLGQCGRPINDKEEYFASKHVHRFDSSLPNDIIAVQCGLDHSMFLTASGKVYSCGWGADGQTGLGHYKSQAEPKRVKGDIKSVKIIKVSCCADTVLALDDQGNVFGWGNGEYGQFSRITLSEKLQFNEPRLLNINNVPGKIVDVAAGATMCAILNDKGQVFVWGFGILGKGPQLEQIDMPSLIPETLFGMNTYNVKRKVIKIFSGLGQFGAITNEGDLFTWGKNRSHLLGQIHGDDQYFPLQVNIKLSNAEKIAFGLEHSGVIAHS